MQYSNASIWKQDTARQLSETATAIVSVRDMQNFLTDVLTEKEITEISARLQAAKMLSEKAKYTDIIAKTSLSSRTVARISDWLQFGAGGYQKAIGIINAHHCHTLPARD